MRTKLKPSHILLIGMCLLLIPALLFADSTGSIKGKVIDKRTGKPIPLANVLVIQKGCFVTGIATGLNGTFRIEDIPAGTYRVEVSMIGYQSRLISKVEVKADKTTNLRRIRFKPGRIELSYHPPPKPALPSNPIPPYPLTLTTFNATPFDGVTLTGEQLQRHAGWGWN